MEKDQDRLRFIELQWGIRVHEYLTQVRRDLSLNLCKKYPGRRRTGGGGFSCYSS